jgi:hypothetical protein
MRAAKTSHTNHSNQEFESHAERKNELDTEPNEHSCYPPWTIEGDPHLGLDHAGLRHRR